MTLMKLVDINGSKTSAYSKYCPKFYIILINLQSNPGN